MKPWKQNQTLFRSARAFTLVEVILATVIATGILVVALFFHSQATNLRAQLLEESDRVAAVRLVMDRLTQDLRHAFAHSQHGFAADATSLRFVTVEAPTRADAGPNASSPYVNQRTDLRLVSYSLSKRLEGTNEIVLGVNHSTQPLAEKPGNRVAPETPSAAGATNSPVRGPEPLTDSIRFFRISYWGGNGWSETWNSSQPPRGVEVILGTDPLPADAALEDYSGEIFRRVIYLPAGREMPVSDGQSRTNEPSPISAEPPL